MNTAQGKGTILNKIGIPSHMVWGYIGVVIFMVGDGLEQGWLSPFLVDHGLSMQQSASLFTMYGIAVTISAWLSGTFVQSLHLSSVRLLLSAGRFLICIIRLS